jgi:hypothetical protein
MYKLLLISILFAEPILKVPFEPQPESWWVTNVAVNVIGAYRETGALIVERHPVGVEYRLPDGRRIDIYHNGVAWEVDWVKKWPEAIGQSLGYAIATNSDPGIVLLMKSGEDEYYNQCLAVITSLRSRGYKVRFLVVNVDNGRYWNK